MAHKIFCLLWCFGFVPISICPAQSFQEAEGREHNDAYRYEYIISEAARRHQVEMEVIKAMIMVESRFDPMAVSGRGARGLMQLMPTTAEMLGVKDCFDPHQNINAGVAYFKRLTNQFEGNIILALAAYNAGPTRVRGWNGIPKDTGTLQYILEVLRCYVNYMN